MVKKALLALAVLLGKKLMTRVVRKAAAKTTEKVPPKS